MGRAKGDKGSLKDIFEGLQASRYGSDVERSLGGRRELNDAARGERWTSEGSSLLPSGALKEKEGE